MRGLIVWGLLAGVMGLALALLGGAGCSAGDFKNYGASGQECYADNTCNAGLACVNGTCVAASGGDPDLPEADLPDDGDTADGDAAGEDGSDEDGDGEIDAPEQEGADHSGPALRQLHLIPAASGGAEGKAYRLRFNWHAGAARKE